MGGQMSKYSNETAMVDEIGFDSRKEARRYKELKLLEKGGVIKDLRLQPHYELQPKYKKNGSTVRSITYVADFEYYDNEKQKLVIEDVKGMKTKTYRLKKKIFEYKYPDLEITEV
jgi:hypothetical protein